MDADKIKHTTKVTTKKTNCTSRAPAGSWFLPQLILVQQGKDQTLSLEEICANLVNRAVAVLGSLGIKDFCKEPAVA